jgi:hypothetical protein
MTAPLRHVFPGEPFKPVAATWNRFIDTTRTVDAARVIFQPGPLLPTVSSGGAQIIQFEITSVDCGGVSWGTVTDVLCSGAEAAIGDVVQLIDPQFELAGNPSLVRGRTGFAVKMSDDGLYGDCAYKVMTTENLGTNCG